MIFDTTDRSKLKSGYREAVYLGSDGDCGWEPSERGYPDPT